MRCAEEVLIYFQLVVLLYTLTSILFNNERHKLELYVASKGQAFNARMFALEQNVNKTVDELAKTTSELNKEKTKSVQLEKEVDRLTMQVFNSTMNNHKLQAKVRGLKLRNAAIENNQTVLRQYVEQRNIDLESQLQDLKSNCSLLEQRVQNIEQNVTSQICTTRNQTQTLNKRKFCFITETLQCSDDILGNKKETLLF